MLAAAIVLAQCAGNAGEECPLPAEVPHAIGLTAVLVWLAIVAGVVLLGGFLLRAKLERRRARRDAAAARNRATAIDRL